MKTYKGIIFDLGMVPTMKYYTGFMIKGYSDQRSMDGKNMIRKHANRW